MHSGIILAQEDSAPLYEIFLGNIRHHTVHRFPHMKGLIWRQGFFSARSSQFPAVILIAMWHFCPFSTLGSAIATPKASALPISGGPSTAGRSRFQAGALCSMGRGHYFLSLRGALWALVMLTGAKTTPAWTFWLNYSSKVMQINLKNLS